MKNLLPKKQYLQFREEYLELLSKYYSGKLNELTYNTLVESLGRRYNLSKTDLLLLTNEIAERANS